MDSHLVFVALTLALGRIIVADDVHLHSTQNFGKHTSWWQDMVGDILDKATGGIEASPHIVGGNEAVPHSHPHQAFIRAFNYHGGSLLCGGFLIAPRWVLTAAHCTDGRENATVFLGSHNITKKEEETQAIIAESLIQHNEWNPYAMTDDLSLIKLSRPAILNQYVQTIRLPAASMKGKNLYKTPVVLTGWGGFSDKVKKNSQILREVKTTIIQTYLCREKFATYITHTMVCADGSDRKGICHGDSGGPMVMTENDGRRTVIGVAAFGSVEGCEKQSPTVFTRIDEYLDWISKHTSLPIRQ